MLSPGITISVPSGNATVPGHVRGPEIELRVIVREERRVPAPLLLGQDVHLRRELGVRRDRSRLGQHLTPLHLLLLRAPQQRTDVVPRPTLVEQLAEHLHTRAGRLGRRTQIPTISTSSPTFTIPRSTRPVTTVPRPVIVNTSSIGIKNGLSISRVGSGMNVSTASINSKIFARPLRITLQRLQRRHPHHRHVVTRELVLVEQLPNLELHQLQDLLVVDHVRLVQRHHDRRHPHLTGQQHMLTGLRHRTIRRRHHQDRAIHLRRTRDHVLDVVRMTRTIHMRVMPILGLILHMRNRDRDPPLPSPPAPYRSDRTP